MSFIVIASSCASIIPIFIVRSSPECECSRCFFLIIQIENIEKIISSFTYVSFQPTFTDQRIFTERERETRFVLPLIPVSFEYHIIFYLLFFNHKHNFSLTRLSHILSLTYHVCSRVGLARFQLIWHFSKSERSLFSNTFQEYEKPSI